MYANGNISWGTYTGLSLCTWIANELDWNFYNSFDIHFSRSFQFEFVFVYYVTHDIFAHHHHTMERYKQHTRIMCECVFYLLEIEDWVWNREIVLYTIILLHGQTLVCGAAFIQCMTIFWFHCPGFPVNVSSVVICRCWSQVIFSFTLPKKIKSKCSILSHKLYLYPSHTHRATATDKKKQVKIVCFDLVLSSYVKSRVKMHKCWHLISKKYNNNINIKQQQRIL